MSENKSKRSEKSTGEATKKAIGKTTGKTVVKSKAKQGEKAMKAIKATNMGHRFKELEALIFEHRGKKVLLDSHVAALYGVPTKRVNEAVFRNRAKFPRAYVFQLTAKEWRLLKSQDATSNKEGGRSVSISSDPSPSSNLAGGKRKPPKVFTEKGLYMLATVLKSKQATQATLQIVETFAKIREFAEVAKALALEKNVSKQKALVSQSGSLIGDILNQEFANDTSSETSIELNLAMIKIKHTIKKERKKERKASD